MRPLLFLTFFACIYYIPANAGKARPCIENLPRDSVSVSSITMNDLLKAIQSTLGTKYHYTLRVASVNNMEARRVHHRREIRYNPSFVQYVLHSTRDKWGLIFLLAHEIAHHELGHTAKRSGSHPSVELEADEFAGALLQKMGASLSEAQEVMLFISSSFPTKTHPGRLDRLIAIRKGWEQESWL